MASITNIKLSATKDTSQPKNWTITVEYDAIFTPFELANFNFRDGFVIWEADDWPNPDDQLTGVVGVSAFNPSASPMHRKMTHVINASTLDTEWFGEELYVVVRLRNVDLNILYTKKSRILHLNP